jgi:hypothetical protein
LDGVVAGKHQSALGVVTAGVKDVDIEIGKQWFDIALREELIEIPFTEVDHVAL